MEAGAGAGVGGGGYHPMGHRLREPPPDSTAIKTATCTTPRLARTLLLFPPRVLIVVRRGCRCRRRLVLTAARTMTSAGGRAVRGLGRRCHGRFRGEGTTSSLPSYGRCREGYAIGGLSRSSGCSTGAGWGHIKSISVEVTVIRGLSRNLSDRRY